MTAPEPAGKAGPNLGEVLSPEEIEALKERGLDQGSPEIFSVTRPAEEPMPEATEQERPTKFTVAKPVADFTILIAEAAMRVENQHAMMGVQQLMAGVRDLRSAVQRKDGLAVISLSVAIGAFALRFYLMATPHYQEIEGETQAQEAEAGAEGAAAVLTGDDHGEQEAPEVQRGRGTQEPGTEAGHEDDGQAAREGGQR